MTRPAAARKLRNFHDQLMATYGPQQWWPAQTPLEVIVGAYLTQNTSWRAVERSIANLVAAGVMHLEGLREIAEEELRTLIRPSGYMVRKAAAIKAFVAFLDRAYGSSLSGSPGNQPALFGRNCWRSLAWVKRPPTPFCSTRCFTQLPVVDESSAPHYRPTRARLRRDHKYAECAATCGGCCICPRPARVFRTASLE